MSELIAHFPFQHSGAALPVMACFLSVVPYLKVYGILPLEENLFSASPYSGSSRNVGMLVHWGLIQKLMITRLSLLHMNECAIDLIVMKLGFIQLGGAWRGISAHAPPYDIVRSMPSNVVVNGSLHWIANHGVSGTSDFRVINPLNVFDSVDDLAISSVMVFDIVEEAFRKIMMPKSLVSTATHNLCLKVIGGSLSVIQYEKLCKLRLVWVMTKESGAVESWSEKISFDFELGFGKILGFRENGEVVLPNKDNDLVAYNLITRQSTNLMASGNKSLYYGAAYKESLGLLLEGEWISATQTYDVESISSGEED